MSLLSDGAVDEASPAVLLKYKTSPTAPGSWSNVTMPLKSIPLVSDAAPRATPSNPSDVATALAFATSHVPSDL